MYQLDSEIFNCELNYTTTFMINNQKGHNMLWKLIKNQMDKQNISVYRLAKMTGLSHNTLQNYKNGHEPSFSNVVKIADALGVSLDEFREEKNG